jgi:23S rRNA (adenine2503-C2)-methyltransferase
MIELRSLGYSDLFNLVNDLNEKPYRSLQIYKWLHKGVTSFDEMTDLSKSLRDKLSNIAYINNIKIIKQLRSKDGSVKFINLLNDNNIIESVFMQYHYGNSLCISTQVGCKMKCIFCASGFRGYTRNLTSGEMLAQILEAQKTLKKKINNIVLMGIGEPLDNFNAVLKFIRIICDNRGLNISERNIALSTCGIIDNIISLADQHLKITLAISLHSPIQKERERLLPIAKKYPLVELIEAIDYYILQTKRRVTIEYGIVENLNDTNSHAELLGNLLKGKIVHVNVIPINPVENFKSSSPNSIKLQSFVNTLSNKYHIKTTIRRVLGQDINASCGQLRNNYLDNYGRLTKENLI